MIFKNQTAVRLILRTTINFAETAPETAKIKFIKPDKTTGEFEAQILNGSETEGDIYVDFSDTIKFEEIGKYTLWADLIFPDGRKGIGRKVSYYVED